MEEQSRWPQTKGEVWLLNKFRLAHENLIDFQWLLKDALPLLSDEEANDLIDIKNSVSNTIDRLNRKIEKLDKAWTAEDIEPERAYSPIEVLLEAAAAEKWVSQGFSRVEDLIEGENTRELAQVRDELLHARNLLIDFIGHHGGDYLFMEAGELTREFKGAKPP